MYFLFLGQSRNIHPTISSTTEKKKKRLLFSVIDSKRDIIEKLELSFWS